MKEMRCNRMAKLKITNKYYFSVEGETEKWYLDWLQDKINNEPATKYKVSIDTVRFKKIL